MDVPETRYTKSADVHIGYQVFADRGKRTLKGVADRWRLFSVVDA